MKTPILRLQNLIRTAFALAVLAASFTACSDDDSDDGEGQPTLSITALTPATGRAGEAITISGTGFGTTPSLNTVSFKSANATPVDALVTEASATTLKVTIPQGAQTGVVTVKVGSKTATSPQPFTLDTSLGLPALVSLNPTNGFVNTEITITGTNFGTDKSVLKVLFGTTEVTDIISATETSIKVKVPATLSAGEIDIKVKRGDSESASGLKFTVNKTPVAVKNVYWSSSNGIYRGAITASGVEITRLYEETNAAGIEIDVNGGFIYWNRPGKILRAPLSGAGPIETLYETSGSTGLLYAVYDLVIDPASGILCVQAGTRTGNQYIHKGSMQGSANQPLTTLYTFPSPRPEPHGIKLMITGNTLYWTEKIGKKIKKGDLSGTEPVTLFDEGDGIGAPTGLTFDADGNIYISDQNNLSGVNDSKIFKGKIDGTGSLSILVPTGSDVRKPEDLEIDLENGFIFWMNQVDESGTATAIMRAKLDGSETEKLFDGFEFGYYFDLEISE